jgi:hypothetical protein
MKILPVGAELLHADGRTEIQTDRYDDTNSRFSQFCEGVLRPLQQFLEVAEEDKLRLPYSDSTVHVFSRKRDTVL